MGKLGLLSAACLLFMGCARTGALQPHATRSVLEAVQVVGPSGWTSAWFDAPFEFDELLPSWNVDGAAEQPFRVELQVRGGGHRQNSPWLDLGGWGDWEAQGLAPTKMTRGQVAVDILKLEIPASQARLRLRTAGNLQLRRLTLCFTRSTLLAGHDFGTGHEYVARIPVPQRRQTDEIQELASRICSPTSVAMVMAHLGVDRSTQEVARRLYDAQHDLYGNWNRAIQGAAMDGLSGHLTRINDWSEAATWLRMGTPLIASIGVADGQLTGAPYEATAGHLLVICGLDGDGHAWVLDPAVPAGELGTRSYKVAELSEVWLRRGGFTYVLGR